MMKKILLLFLASLLVGFLLATPSIADAGDHCIVPQSVRATPPDTGVEPVRVSVFVFLLDIVEIDEVRESFDADLMLSLDWVDPRLAAASLGHSLEHCRIGLEDIWHPQIGVVNQRKAGLVSNADVSIDGRGHVSFSERIAGTFSSRLDVTDFPFDQQRLDILIASFEYSPDEVIFETKNKAKHRLDSANLAGWEILENLDQTDLPHLISGSQEHTQLAHAIVVKRDPIYILLKVMLPLGFIVLMAWSVLWLDPEQHAGQQIGVATASIFALIAFLLSLRSLLPRVSYLTSADYFVLAATVLVFLALAEVVLTSRLVVQGKVDLARRADVYGRWTYISVFIGLALLMLLK